MKTSSKINFRSLVKEYRETKYLTQEELGELLGVTFVTVNRWENGVFEPSLKQKRKLHKLFIEAGLIEK